MTKQLFLLAAFSVLCSLDAVSCARILGVFPFPSRSHFILGNSLMRGLAEAGHDVTMLSPYEDRNPPIRGSYRNILLEGLVERFENMTKSANFLGQDKRSIISTIFLQKGATAMYDRALNQSEVKELLSSDEKFDAVIVEQFFNDVMKVFAYRFEAPLILFSSVGANDWVNGIAGNPSPLSYIPHTLTEYPPHMTFFQRVKNVFFYLLDQAVKYYYTFPKNEEILKKHFSNPPDFFEMYHNASLILLNSHESMSQAVPLVPNMVQISGYHIKPPKELPEDLQEYLDDAKEGVVYFSMGSTLKSKDFPPERRDLFLRAFGKLKEKVLWKWEDDVLPNQPPNVRLGKWLPQQDILAHPNVKVFVTHGGLLSLTETVYHGVPILAIPVYGDQYSNANSAVNNGYALSLPYKDPTFSEEKLSRFLEELLHNPKYRDNVKQRSSIFHDRPLKPMKNAIFWVEHVIRHRGAPHLRVAGIQLPWYKYFLVDVIAFMVGVSVSVLFLLYLGIKHVLNRRKNFLQTVKEKKKD